MHLEGHERVLKEYHKLFSDIELNSSIEFLTKEDIRKAYLNASKKYHPDVIANSETENTTLIDTNAKMAKLNNAYSILKEKCDEYNRIKKEYIEALVLASSLRRKYKGYRVTNSNKNSKDVLFLGTNVKPKPIDLNLVREITRNYWLAKLLFYFSCLFSLFLVFIIVGITSNSQNYSNVFQTFALRNVDTLTNPDSYLGLSEIGLKAYIGTAVTFILIIFITLTIFISSLYISAKRANLINASSDKKYSLWFKYWLYSALFFATIIPIIFLIIETRKILDNSMRKPSGTIYFVKVRLKYFLIASIWILLVIGTGFFLASEFNNSFTFLFDSFSSGKIDYSDFQSLLKWNDSASFLYWFGLFMWLSSLISIFGILFGLLSNLKRVELFDPVVSIFIIKNKLFIKSKFLKKLKSFKIKFR
ncbi:DnaJ-like protein [Mycoplasma testudineum]|uniref:DnaJ-like protein n=1 Tax=Mycoplasma testudineum TaxID=244584 RepID=A0A4R6IH40_9MOLU|nr:J domain-containing protein [Mycoplasma testudineum]OYD27119.1 hypothetical protein CG473_00545 [Mycoplasma testudineum]TDO21128.1 DnaJ-like protein [Mycoplasma testudineum]